MQYKDFYSEVGKLLYAVANIDGVITPQEKKELEDRIKKDLVPAEKHKDEFGTNAAYYAEIEFEYLESEISDSDSAFQSFINYIEDHHTAIDEKMKNYCLFLADRIANAYHGTNKKEKELIDKLKAAIKKI